MWPKLIQTPKRDQFIKQTNKKYSISSRATLNETFMAKNNDIFPERPKLDQNPKFTPLNETTSIHVHSIWESPPGGGGNT